MYEILKKESLNPTVTRMVVSAPEVDKRQGKKTVRLRL